MRRLPRQVLAPIALVAACYGGLDNAPFQPHDAIVHGRLAGPRDPDTAWAAVVGDPASTTVIAADGTFTLPSVPAGDLEIAAANGLGGAARAAVTIVAGQPLALELAPAAGATIGGTVTLDGGGAAKPVHVRVDEYPLGGRTDALGRFELEGVPAGCVSVIAESEGFEPATAHPCPAAGETTALELHLAPIGPQRAACEACASDHDCASGTCLDRKYQAGEEHVCATPCTTNGECPDGWVCTEDHNGGVRACVPAAGSCFSFGNMTAARACSTADDCGFGKDDPATCVERRCSVTCHEDAACGLGHLCMDRANGKGTCR